MRRVVVVTAFANLLGWAACNGVEATPLVEPVPAGLDGATEPSNDAAPEAGLDAGPAAREPRIYLFDSTSTATGPAVLAWSARIEKDDSLSWREELTLPTVTYDFDVVTFDNAILLIGGYERTAEAGLVGKREVWRAKLDAGGKVASWAVVGELPAGSGEHAAVSDGKTVHVLGGASYGGQPGNALPLANVLVSTPLSNADSMTFVETLAMPGPVRRARGARVGDKVFAIGGTDLQGNNDENLGANVLVGRTETNGTVGEWEAGTALPSGAYVSASATVVGDHVYVAGHGETVRYSAVTATGFGPWELGVKLVGWPFHTCLAAVGRRLYILGGSSVVGAGSLVPKKLVRVANIDPTWSLSALRQLGDLPAALAFPRCVVVGGP